MMTRQDQIVFDQLDKAFDEMETAMRRLKAAGLQEAASFYGSKWVEFNDLFHAQRANGECGSRALNDIGNLEDEICGALERHNLVRPS